MSSSHILLKMLQRCVEAIRTVANQVANRAGISSPSFSQLNNQSPLHLLRAISASNVPVGFYINT